MPLQGHEAFDLNELLLSCVNSINCMGFFKNHATDAQLKQMLEKHMDAHIRDYNMKVEWATKQQCKQTLSVPAMPAKMTQAQPPTPQPVTPKPDASNLDDRAIATSYLLTLKRAGREYAWAAFEASDPQLRQFLEDAFRMNSRHALEVSQWMTQKGYYPTEPASNTYLLQLAKIYQPVQEMAGVH
ncbi:spore coat protein [Alicyclobacillus kakegawensis]|uniref:spore coat protein n=1 Tax=Alicyclobacillus kakegawensis TaxID=392012 RepID=UPI00083648B3|nr:spore coat protein [Alicyclobacillus kakegawensis]